MPSKYNERTRLLIERAKAMGLYDAIQEEADKRAGQKLEEFKAEALRLKLADSPKPMSGMFVGWRVWTLKPDIDRYPELQLNSFNNSIWQPNEEFEAKCGMQEQDTILTHRQHAIPGFQCSCGVYACTDPREVEHLFNRRDNNIACIGTVNLWGRVVECEKGFRAQYAYPRELFTHEHFVPYLKAYGISVMSIKYFEEFKQEYIRRNEPQDEDGMFYGKYR